MMKIGSRRIAVCGWRARLLFDAYRRLPDASGTHRAVLESYEDLAIQRGHSVPKDAYSTIQGFKSQIQRCSSDSEHYENGGWNQKYPDLFYRVDKGWWGIRPEILEQLHKLGLDENSLLVGVPPVQPLPPSDVMTLGLFETSDQTDNQKLYIIQMLAESMNLVPGRLIVKIGISDDPYKRRDELQTGNPGTLIIRRVVQCQNASALENTLHTMLSGKKMAGEWFDIDVYDAIRIAAAIQK